MGAHGCRPCRCRDDGSGLFASLIVRPHAPGRRPIQSAMSAHCMITLRVRECFLIRTVSCLCCAAGGHHKILLSAYGPGHVGRRAMCAGPCVTWDSDWTGSQQSKCGQSASRGVSPADVCCLWRVVGEWFLQSVVCSRSGYLLCSSLCSSLIDSIVMFCGRSVQRRHLASCVGMGMIMSLRHSATVRFLASTCQTLRADPCCITSVDVHRLPQEAQGGHMRLFNPWC